MAVMRALLLAASNSPWLRRRATRYAFARRAVSRFMPGEDLSDALAAARELNATGLGSVLTRLGENVADWSEAEAVTRHYLDAMERIRSEGLDAELSIKLTQLGLDLDAERCYGNLAALANGAANAGCFLWIDMEQSRYVERTLELARRARAAYQDVGVCVQAYLRRTPADVESLLAAGVGVRLVKGAYQEPPSLALPRKRDVDSAYDALARTLLDASARSAGLRAVFGTHDGERIAAVQSHAGASGLAPSACEFHLLYGIRRSEQSRLAQQGTRVRVLVSYGPYWFPWYMRRLAERPANLGFVLRSLFR